MKTVTLWHGTTKSAAEQIAGCGFQPMSVAAIVSDVALEHGVAARDLFETLEAAGRFVAVQPDRDDAVWLTTNRVKAIDWAQRAPEVRWEALWAVWWLTHGGLERVPRPWLDLDASGWHARQFFADPPAVIEVEVPIDRVRGQGQEPLSPENVLRRIELKAKELCVAHPVPLEWVLGYEVIPREVDFTAAAGILGIEIAELAQKVDAGEVAPPREPRTAYEHTPYWHLDEFLRLLPNDDQSKVDVRTPPLSPPR